MSESGEVVPVATPHVHNGAAVTLSAEVINSLEMPHYTSVEDV
jgi:hypothetical protein